MSHENFQIGEEAFYERPGSPYFGIVVKITGPLAIRPIFRGESATYIDELPTYQVDASGWGICKNPTGWLAEARHLRKRRPPQDWVKICNLTDIPREAVCDHEWIRAGRKESAPSLCLQCGVVNG